VIVLTELGGIAPGEGAPDKARPLGPDADLAPPHISAGKAEAVLEVTAAKRDAWTGMVQPRTAPNYLTVQYG